MYSDYFSGISDNNGGGDFDDDFDKMLEGLVSSILLLCLCLTF